MARGAIAFGGHPVPRRLGGFCCNSVALLAYYRNSVAVEKLFMSIHTVKTSVSVPAEIQQKLERAGLRRTLATRAVLGLFLSQPQATVNHAQAFASLAARGIDINRVTLYRLLDRLVACGVLKRHADDDARTWRFGLVELSTASTVGRVPRFECDACHRQFRLPEAVAPTELLAAQWFNALTELGHQGLRLEMAIHGTCSSCVPSPAHALATGSTQ